MTTSALRLDAPPAVPAPDAWRRDRRFFTGMALAALLTVFAGFAPSYYLKAVTGRPGFSGVAELSPLLHAHGLAFTAWMVLLVVQARLVATRRVGLHRRLGVFGAALAVLMVGLGFMAAVDAARRGAAPPGVPPLAFLAIPIFDLVIFSALVIAGLWYRRRTDVHRRLMLISTIALLTPALARLPGIIAAGPLAFFALTDAFLVPLFVYDRKALGRVHRATWGGAAALVASQVGRLAVSASGAWLALATWLTR